MEAFRPLLEWIIADRMCCCFEGYDYGTFCAIYGFSVVDFFLSCLSSGPISSDTTSLFTQRFKFSFSSLDGTVLIFLKAFSSRSKYINLIIYNHVKNFFGAAENRTADLPFRRRVL